MKKISQIIIIFNPNSTGNSKKNAQELRESLKKEMPGSVKISIKSTSYAGHAEKIAGSYAKQTSATLVVSSSGDGGYNEVINGALSHYPNNVFTSVLPSGNANDHFNAVANNNLITDILNNNYRTMDVLKVTSIINKKLWHRYAHSYVGIGLTPVIGKQLTSVDLNWFNEKWLLIKYLFKFKYSKVIVNGQVVKYSSLVFSNVDRMSKVLRLSDEASINDGKFEINSIKHQSKFTLLLYLFRAATLGLSESVSKKSFTFTTINPLLVQLDGEVYTLDVDSKVLVESVPKVLKIIM